MAVWYACSSFPLDISHVLFRRLNQGGERGENELFKRWFPRFLSAMLQSCIDMLFPLKAFGMGVWHMDYGFTLTKAGGEEHRAADVMRISTRVMKSFRQ